MKEFIEGKKNIVKIKGFRGSNSIIWAGNEIGYEEDLTTYLVTITYYLR